MEKINSRNVKVICDCGEDTIWRFKTPQEMRDEDLEECLKCGELCGKRLVGDEYHYFCANCNFYE
jgi:hypothetical protein